MAASLGTESTECASLLQVKRLQEVLREETALHGILENALDHAAVTLADMSYLPTNVRTRSHLSIQSLAGPAARVVLTVCAYHRLYSLQAQELLSNISAMETAVSKLEEDMVSLHFQLIQERNERRLVEYRLKQRPLCSHHGSAKSQSDVRLFTHCISVPDYSCEQP